MSPGLYITLTPHVLMYILNAIIIIIMKKKKKKK